MLILTILVAIVAFILVVLLFGYNQVSQDRVKLTELSQTIRSETSERKLLLTKLSSLLTGEDLFEKKLVNTIHSLQSRQDDNNDWISPETALYEDDIQGLLVQVAKLPDSYPALNSNVVFLEIQERLKKATKLVEDDIETYRFFINKFQQDNMKPIRHIVTKLFKMNNHA